MNIAKYLLILIWIFLFLSVTLYLIRQIVFKKKTITSINLSEAIYISFAFLSIAIILSGAIKSILVGYDNLKKIQDGNFLFKFFKSSSAISVTGIIIFICAFYATKFISQVLLGNRKDIIELDADNKAFAVIKGAILLTVCILFSVVADSIYLLLIPSITVPFYH